ncbi:MAG TPA: hypothetical protein P5014_02355 [Patescibacteria group bacterium]|nr:hypothetical protein [Patescibacteria group bacterium]
MPYQFKIKNIKNKKLVAVLFISTVLIIILIFSSNRKKPGSDYKTITDNKTNVSKSSKDEQSEDSGVTKPPVPETGKTIIEQISNDYEFTKYWENIYREYPWYKKLPIVNNDYKIYWVVQEKSFRIRLAVSENSPEEQKRDIINKALKDIEDLTGVSYENYPYYVLYTENKN